MTDPRLLTTRILALTRCLRFLFSLSALVLAGLFSAHAGPAPVQTFYVPLPEAQVQASLKSINSSTGSQMQSVISIAATGNNTVIYYDHWEDGYENDIANPLQSTTEIWGDGNVSNGIPPGFATDTLIAGDVISLEDLVDLPRDPSTIDFDGSDKIGATKAIAVTRAEWAKSPGTVLAGAVEVYPVRDYGLGFESPVGENTADSSSMFEHTAFLIMASEDGTTVNIDKDADDTDESTVVLSEGEAYHVNGGVLVGGSVSADKPIQVNLITGDVGSRYESRWYTLYPTEQWSDSFYSPVGTANDGDATFVFLYNPDLGTNPDLAVSIETKNGPTTASVPGGTTVKYQVPRNSGAKFSSTDGRNFFAIATVGANPGSNLVHDWGFSLVPEGNLTPALVIGWGPGSDPTQPPLRDGSPVWVTATGDTTVYIDYDGDGVAPFDIEGEAYDVSIPVSLLESKLVFDPNDNDQTGMRLFTVDGALLTAAWGQNPGTAGPGNPFLDMGTTVLPFPVPSVRKTHTLTVENLPADGFINVGETIRYTVEVNNDGVVVLGGLVVLDALPPMITYVAGSSTVDGVPIADDGVGSPFPFDESGYLIASIPPNESTIITYDVTVDAGATSIQNVVTVDNDQTPLNDSTTVIVVPPQNATPCSDFFFADATFTDFSPVYGETDTIYLTLTDGDQNFDPLVAESLFLTVTSVATGDVETLDLAETGPDTGVFRYPAGLPTSPTAGQAAEDGTLFAAAGDQLQADYTDFTFPDTCSINTTMTVPTETKTLYLTGDGQEGNQSLDRSDPSGETPVDTSTATTATLSGGGIWQYRKQLTFNNGTRPEDLLDFPVLVHLTSSNFDFTKAELNGEDIRFYDSDGTTPLKYEIEFWNSGTEEAYVWVRVPQIDGSSTTDSIWMEYGNDSVTDAQDAENVWNSNYKAVWHMGESSGTIFDSTAGNFDGTPTSVTQNVTGQIDGADTYNGSSSKTVLANGEIITASATEWTWASWVYLDAPAANYDRVFIQGSTGSPGQQVMAYTRDNGNIEFASSDTGSNPVAAVNISTGEWAYVVWVHTASGDTTYLNGLASSAATAGSGVGMAGPNQLGARNSGNYFDGNLDEMRLLQTEVSANWVSAQHASMTDALISFGAEQPVGGGGGDTASFTQLPAMLDPFIMPVGAQLGVTTYVQTTAPLDSGSGSITVANTTSDSSNSTNSLSFSHDPGTGSNRLLLVAIGVGATASAGDPPALAASNPVTFGGTPLDFVDSRVSNTGGAGDDTVSYIYQMVNPPSGAANVIINLVGNGSLAVGATTFDGVDQTTPLGSPVNAGQNNSSPSVSITAAVDEVVFGTTSIDQNPSLTVPGNQTALWNIQGGNTGTVSAAASIEPGASPVTHSYSSSSGNDWAIIAVAIKPAPATGGLILPSTVTLSHIGTGGATIATLTDPTVTDLGSNVYQLDYSTVLGSETTVPAGNQVKAEILTDGIEFNVLYDSLTYPSRIDLGTTTVIKVTEIAVYDAPYPGGSLVTDANNGDTLYIRTTATDPFGADDITALDLLIDDPVAGPGAPIAVTNVVSSSGNTKIFEYVWATNSNEGSFGITATATEGLEAIPVTATKATSVNLSALDLGTPGVVEWTDPSGNVLVDSYDPDDTTYLRVTDFDQAGQPEPILVVVTSSNGDTVTVTLTETTPGSGIFTGPLPSTDTTTPNPGDGTLQAPAGATLSASYTDPTDPTDMDTDPSLITVPGGGPGVAIGKILLDPSDGTALVGDNVVYQITVSNAGTGTLNTVSVSDDYPAGLAFVTASEAGFSDNGDVVSWANVGPLAEGASKVITVTFTAATAGDNQLNSASAGGDATAGPVSAPIDIKGLPGLTVTKVLTGGSPNPAFIGDQVSYDIVVTNSGDTDVAIVPLPLTDSFPSCLEYASATSGGLPFGADAVGGGIALWNNVGPLATGATRTITVTFEVVGACSPVTNVAMIDQATDDNGTEVPPTQDSDSSLATQGASIGDYIWSDLDGDGVQDSNEVPLAGVTVFLDENGNGVRDPDEQFDVTDANGLYELNNLAPGTYTVKVETSTLPAGTAQTGDPDASPDNATTVTLTAGETVVTADFGYQGGTGSIAGQVRNDINGDGDLAASDSGLEGITVSLYSDENGNGMVDAGDILLGTRTTDANGDYLFEGLGTGDYLVVETDPNGASSTNDKDNDANQPAGTDNAIALALLDTQPSVGNDFLDTNVGSNTISGTVIDDQNGNGVDDTELGIPGVRVELFIDGNGNGVFDTGETLFATTVTDGNGDYIFTNVPDGNYAIVETDPNGATSTNDATGAAADNNIGVNVGSGNPVSAGNDFLDTGASLAEVSGTVFNDADKSGSFTGGDTRLENVAVELYLDENNNGIADPTEPLVSSTTTDSLGNYLFTGIPDGEYVVVEFDPPNTGSVTDVDGTTGNSANEVEVNLAGTDSTGNNFLDSSASISGQVREDTDNDGDLADPDTGVAGVLVELYNDVNDNGVYEPGTDTLVATTATDADGNYSFTGLGDGSYVVVETDPAGSSSTNDRSNDPLGSLGTDNGVAVQISGGADSTGNDFLDTNVNETTIAGSVLNDTDGDGDLADPDAGVAGVPIALYTDPNGDGDPSDGVLVATTTTSADGSYSFDSVAPGNYVLEESDPTGATSTNDKDNDPLGPAGTDNSIKLTLSGTPSIDNDFLDTGVTTSTIGGQVTDGSDPIPGVVITLKNDGGIVIGTTVTDANGNYSFPNLPDGTYTVEESNPPGTTGGSDSDGPANGDDTIEVTLSGSDSLNNDFVDTGATLASIAGTVYDDGPSDSNTIDGEDIPIPTVEISLVSDTNGNGLADPGEPVVATTTTSGDGSYSFDNLPLGDYAVVETNPSGVTSDDFDAQGALDDNTIGVTLTAGGSTGNDFLDDGLVTHTISGQVRDDLDSDGQFSDPDRPVGGVTVSLYHDANGDGIAQPGELIESTTTDGSGNYQFTNLPDGDFLVAETDPNGASSTADAGPDNGDSNLIPVTVAGSDRTGNDFLDAIDPAGYIYDSLTGEIIPGGTISVNQDSGPPAVIDIMQDGSTGQYSFEVDQPGTYTIGYTPPPRYIIDPNRPVSGPSYDVSPGPGTEVLGTYEDSGNPGFLTDPGSGANPYYLTFVLEAGDKLVINNNIPLLKLKAKNYGEFLADAGLTAGTPDGQPLPDGSGTGGNPDGDWSSNLLEHAFCDNPTSGVPNHQGFCVELVNAATGQMDAAFIRPEGVQDVIYTLQGADSMLGPWFTIDTIAAGQPAGGGFIAVSNGDQTETVTYANVQNDAGYANTGFGFARLCVSLDSEPDGTPDTIVLPSDGSSVEATDYTKTFGWQCVDYNVNQCASFSHPYSNKPVFTGTVDGNTAASATVDATASAGGVDLASLNLGPVDLDPGAGVQLVPTHYLQITSGLLEGERFDIASASGGVLTLVDDPDIFTGPNPALSPLNPTVESLNTSHGVPADDVLAGASFQVLPHKTIDQLFDKTGAFAGLESTSDETRLLFYDNRNESKGFATLSLADTGSLVKWIYLGDAGAIDQGSRPVDRCAGNYIHSTAAGNTVCGVGLVADYDIACPFNEGYNLAGAVYPLNQTPTGTNGRDMVIGGAADQFNGSGTPSQASELMLWRGDYTVDELPSVVPYVEGYESYMAADDGGTFQRWVDPSDPALNDLGIDAGGPLLLPSWRAVTIEMLPGNALVPHIYPLLGTP